MLRRAIACGAFAVLILLPGIPSAAADAEADALRLRWLGVAGFSLELGEQVVLIDPFVSRPGIWRTLTRRYRPDPQAIGRLLAPSGPAPEAARAGLILIGHSHYDHLGDAPAIASATGAELLGSRTSAVIAEAYGLLPSRARVLEIGESHAVGRLEVQALASRHARVLLGRVPLEGQLTEPPDAPIHALSFVLGDARAWLLRDLRSGFRVLHLSSAGLEPRALAALEPGVDVVLAASTGRDENYAARLVAALRPRLVVLHHFDSFFRGLDDPEAGAARDPDDLAAFERELLDAAEALGHPLEVRRPVLFEPLTLSPAAGRASAP